MRAVFDKIIVVDQAAPEKIGSIYTPPSSTDSLVIRGKIVAVGEEVDKLFKADDIIHYNRHSTFPLELNNKKYRVLPAREILAVE